MNGNNPKIAVLLSFYHRDKLAFFEEAMASIEAQTYSRRDIRIYLVVDGPVPPEHEALLERQSGSFYKLHRRRVNGGLALALNDLLDLLEDEKYVFRMDGDDIAFPDRFRVQVQFMEDNPNIDLLGANACDIDERSAVVGRRTFPEKHDSIVRVISRVNPILHPTYCLRGASLARDRLRYPDAFLTEDWAFLFEAVSRGWRLHNVQRDLLGWRVCADFFQRRRGIRRGLQELKTTWSGTWQLRGATPELLWPLARFCFRLLPPWFVEKIYSGRLRSRVSKQQSD